MAQFDVHRNRAEPENAAVPYLLDVQSDLLDIIGVRVVVPLVRIENFERPIRGLNPRFEIEDHTVVMASQLIVGMSLRNLGQVVIGLHDRRHAIVGAIDMLIGV
jgi:toxin CcdB